MFQLSGSLRASLIAIALFSLGGTAPTTKPFAPAPRPIETFDTGIIHVDRFGSGGGTLILIPGLASGSWVWHQTIAKFSPANTVYVLTLPGFDGRAASREKSLFTAFARDFWTMLDARKIKMPVIIGHSLGGTLAIALAEEHSERLRGIIAADGLPVFPMLAFATPKQREATATQMANSYASLSEADELAAEKSYMSTIGTNKPELVESTAQLEAKSDPKAVAAWLKEDLTCDLRPALNKITIPFLEIMPFQPSDAKPQNGYSQEQTLAFYKSLIAEAAKGSVAAIAPSRHFVMLDQPEAFQKAVSDFLSSLR